MEIEVTVKTVKTVILKWNPSISSYNMKHFLDDLCDLKEGFMPDFNWSIWDHAQVEEGARFFWVKVGSHGQLGIVGAGEITSDPYPGEDWSGKGREVFYADFEPEVLINPDAMPILTVAELQAAIPDFEWDKGHSGLVLSDEQAERLEECWSKFLEVNKEAFEKANDDEDNDLIYMDL